MATNRTIEQVFTTAWTSFQSATSFWILGNAFDTLLDYFRLYPEARHDPSDGAIGLTKALTGGGEAWYDDDGWWVIAALKAYQVADQLNWAAPQKQGFYDFAVAKWQRFNTYSPNIWRYCASTLITGSGANTANYRLAPKRIGGVWNSGWAVPGYPVPEGQDFWVHAGNGRPPQPWNPDGDLLGGFQNTVTNSLYLVAAQRFATSAMPAPTDGIGNRACADAEFTFLTSWFTDSHAPLLNQASSSQPGKHPAKGALVRERVGQYRNPAIPVQGYEADQAWAGDQGIVLGGMIDRMLLLEKAGQTGLPDYQTALDTALAILAGVQGNPDNGGAPNPNELKLIDESGVLHNWPLGGQAPGNNYTGAYCTGVSAFMRYLTYAYVNSAQIRAYCNTVQPGQSQSFSQRIIAMAGSVMTSDYTIGSWTSDPYLKEFDGGDQVSYDVTALGVMLAAYVMQTAR